MILATEEQRAEYLSYSWDGEKDFHEQGGREVYVFYATDPQYSGTEIFVHKTDQGKLWVLLDRSEFEVDTPAEMQVLIDQFLPTFL